MAAHWSDAYVGQPYVAGEHDCAALAVQVQREVFGREVLLPAERAHGLRGMSAQIESLKEDYAVRVETPAEGDAVLMVGRGHLDHIGLYCLIDGVPYVLHAMKKSGQVVRHRLRELLDQGLKVEAFYRWV